MGGKRDTLVGRRGADQQPVFADALARYFDGVPDPRTLAKLGAG